ncbi:hypothetical protein [Zavarzinella formosa]|uniref:hypothetical protein n=1 Tax=Zavarzinella formosa TaxID=360055 RepID=UPI0002E43ACA|nr:hypothetical protein [Zavarzinella formosa]
MFITTYDIREEGFGAMRFAFWGMVLMFSGIAYLLFSGNDRRLHNRRPLLMSSASWEKMKAAHPQMGEYVRPHFMVYVVVLFLTVVAWIGAVHITIDRCACLRQARTGDFEVVEGNVRNYSTRLDAKGRVNGEYFTVGDSSFWMDESFHGGLEKMSVNGGPIREGEYVRLSYHGGQILRVEVWK